MSKTILALACLLIATSAIHLSYEEDEQDSSQYIVNIKGSNGKYLSSSNGFDLDIGAYRVSASVSESDPTKSWAQWIIEQHGDKYALKSVATGKYISRCNNCWSGVKNPQQVDSLFVHVDDSASGDWALWTPTYLDNGKWSFQADTGKYANLCHDCLQDSHFEDYAFVEAENPLEDESAQWQIIEAPKN